nr:mitotic checkpoint serine/threonine-protein kinase BUB1 beta isoform X2 [Misgurnus anguillicaudatus]XP_055041960.1 mitotic checkpoint serine/threonine-protein kinase BUB1 beta isoform X2 [Misgurnus anguillicaudatus]
MALGFEKAKCDLPRNNNNMMLPQKMDDLAISPHWSNPVESLVSSQRSQEEQAVAQQDANVQIMYSKDQVYQGDKEFSIEELRAQRYYKALSDKAIHLNKLKQDLKLQIEQKQRLLQQKNSAATQQIVDEDADSSIQTSEGECQSAPTEMRSAPFKIYSEQESDVKSRSSVSSDMTEGGSDPKRQKMTTSKPFTVFDENPQSNKMSFSTNRTSLKLPTLSLKPPKAKAEHSTDREASISRSEEPIINGHWNKTVCRSPNDTCEFARAAQLASTPFGGPERPKLTEDLSTTASEAPQASNSDVITETKKLSPIQEISHDWGSTSIATVIQETIKDNAEISPCVEISEMPPADEVKTEDICSWDVRARLLDQVDLGSFTNFHRKTGLLPPASGNDDLLLDGEMLYYRSEMGRREDYTLYSSITGTVVLKVDSSSVPWDFFISSKIRASLSSDEQDADVQISCYVYDNGCVTLWRIPHEYTIEDLEDEFLAKKNLPHWVIRLLEMVKRIHSCHIVHAGLKTETLYFYHSDIMALDFSSSVDLQLQTDVKTAEVLSSAQDYIKQGLLMKSASPYQVDLIGVAEVVHMLVLNRPLKVVRGNSGWTLDEDSDSHHSSPVDAIWKNFFHIVLNPEEQSTEVILSRLISDLKNSY